MVRFLTLLILIYPFAVMAKTEAIQYEKKIFVLTFPDDWVSEIDLFDLPITILGPMQEDYRPVISVIPTGIPSKDVKEELYKDAFLEQKAEKEKWLQEHKGKLLKFEPYTIVSLRPDLKGHFIGAEYLISGIHYIERSYFLHCGDQFVNVKYSTREELREVVPQLIKIAGSLKCM
jgi:hypothetical protein